MFLFSCDAHVRGQGTIERYLVGGDTLTLAQRRKAGGKGRRRVDLGGGTKKGTMLAGVFWRSAGGLRVPRGRLLGVVPFPPPIVLDDYATHQMWLMMFRKSKKGISTHTCF